MRTSAEEVELALRELVVDRLPKQRMDLRLMNRRREALPVFVDELRSDSKALIPLESDLQVVQQEEFRLGNLGFPAERLWMSALNPEECLISDLLYPMPDQPGLEHGLLRFGTLVPGETALDWDFAIALPAQPAGLEFEVFRIDPIWLSPAVWTVMCDIGTKDRKTGHEERHEYVYQFVPPAEFADCRTGWHDY